MPDTHNLKDLIGLLIKTRPGDMNASYMYIRVAETHARAVYMQGKIIVSNLIG